MPQGEARRRQAAGLATRATDTGAVAGQKIGPDDAEKHRDQVLAAI
jgi:hypothetical protein